MTASFVDPITLPNHLPDRCPAGEAGPYNTLILRPEADGRVLLSLVLIPGFALGDLARVVDTLAAANAVSGRDIFQWQTVGLEPGPVPSASDIDVHPVTCVTDSPAAANILVLAEILPPDLPALPGLIEWLHEADRAGAHIGALSSGAILLSRIGLLRGYACATPTQLAFTDSAPSRNDELFCRERGPARLHPDLFVIDRNRFTCAGGCTTSDMMLRAIRQCLGDDAARRVTGQLLRDRARDADEIQPRAQLVQHAAGSQALQRAMQVMRRHAEQPVELRVIAMRAGVHLRHLERLFRRHLETSPREFYLRLRLQRARELMQCTTATLSSIARDVGFDSLSHFSKCYTEAYGTRPSEDRKRLFTTAVIGPHAPSRDVPSRGKTIAA
ncbi:GlxA family transcriptional regulator [Dongia soli]|uniref:Helix-turn-helix domain-containing protein n=1 Tax=Dongia soli TaxID=600628 RepID=A0ABU5EBS6_9PROT|nr:helix-turn-helix domain-containing protein [Dongia soli]MDY0883801.1 helix-turn-helix domain-containing protein [Dongia soli]